MSQGGIESDIDLYDSDRNELARLANWLNEQNVGKPRNVQKYAEELVERFHKIGFHVEVRMYVDEDIATGETLIWYPYILIEARVEPEEEFDHDKMRFEVRSDILGVNAEGNVQKKMVGQAGYGRTPSGLIVPGGGPV